jgi:secreted trypsin-like serine protease
LQASSYIASVSSSVARNQGEAANLDDLLKDINSRGTNSTTRPVPAIVGGVPSENGEYPWFGRIDIRFSNGAGLTCGATLIHTDFAISAAHCLINYLSLNPDLSWTVKFHLGAIQYDGSDGTVMEVEQALYPSDYDTTLATNDIILYKLRTATDVEPLAWNANPLLPAVYAPVTIVGFGLTTDQGNGSSILLKADVEIISNQQCKSFYGSYVLYNVVCALSPGKGSCQGDSGGPIFTANGFTENLMYGVGSYGGKCGEKPVGFTRTSSFRKFIQTVCIHIHKRVFQMKEEISYAHFL